MTIPTRPTRTPTPIPSRTPKLILARAGWQVGDQALDFTLADLQGSPVRLSSLRGKVVVLNFWATWCPPCLAELPDLQSFYADYASRAARLPKQVIRAIIKLKTHHQE